MGQSKKFSIQLAMKFSIKSDQLFKFAERLEIGLSCTSVLVKSFLGFAAVRRRRPLVPRCPVQRVQQLGLPRRRETSPMVRVQAARG